MKKLLLIPAFLSLGACASRMPASQLNCERLHDDSSAKLEEMKKVFKYYQEVNYDLAVKLSPALKEEVVNLDERVRRQKQKCWPKEARPIDGEMAQLKDDLVKVYGDLPPKPPKKPRVPANEYFAAGRAGTVQGILNPETAPPAPAPTVAPAPAAPADAAAVESAADELPAE